QDRKGYGVSQTEEFVEAERAYPRFGKSLANWRAAAVLDGSDQFQKGIALHLQIAQQRELAVCVDHIGEHRNVASVETEATASKRKPGEHVTSRRVDLLPDPPTRQ